MEDKNTDTLMNICEHDMVYEVLETRNHYSVFGTKAHHISRQRVGKIDL
jgi:hypothetical protein